MDIQRGGDYAGTANLSVAELAGSVGSAAFGKASLTGINRKEVVSVFEAFSTMLAVDLGRRGPGVSQVPGLMKVTVKRMPAKKARKGINPFTGEETIFKAKPARNVVKVRPLKALKDKV